MINMNDPIARSLATENAARQGLEWADLQRHALTATRIDGATTEVVLSVGARPGPDIGDDVGGRRHAMAPSRCAELGSEPSDDRQGSMQRSGAVVVIRKHPA